MILVNLEGPAEALDEFTLQCSEYLHSPGEREGKKQDEKNPYSGLLAKIEKVAANSGIALERQNVRALTASEEEIRRFTDEFYDGFCDMQSRLQALEESVARCRDVVTQLRHLQGMGLRFENIFSTRFLKVRFGKRHAHRVRDALTERARRRFHAGGMAVFGMARRLVTELAEVL